MKTLLKLIHPGTLIGLYFLYGCTADVNSLTGPSNLGNTLAISAFYGSAGVPTGGGQATIRVEVTNANGQGVNGATILLTTTLGSLNNTTLTTVNGVANAVLTSGANAGMAYVVASVDNVTATAAVPIVVI
ncbi:MAG: hypothetical protein G3M78_03105 [Candidatus Nitrohelix vancouverensis]|uniref:Big-1 domain-containing protein n=1 Tax=Candidatus Nitrohelix vancouverensis TaxID=2705534 RepID=A0A7T0C0S1_9BACT|nr:MAG: hypothetical protein G3M78_03105 [Candidatus Nitrohelix vancouverensis]